MKFGSCSTKPIMIASAHDAKGASPTHRSPVMSQPKRTRMVTILNRQGLHARPATLVREVVLSYPARVELVKDGQRVDGTDVLQILALGALPGEQILLEATGEQADQALEALVRLFENKFDEEE